LKAAAGTLPWRIAAFTRGRVAHAAASLFEERPSSHAPPEAFPTAGTRQPAGDGAIGAVWDETLQVAARLKLVVGAHRRVVTVTGMHAADGGTLLAARLAAAMAHIDHSPVLVVDGNVAAPRLGALFGLSPGAGLLDALDGRADLQEAIHRVTPDNLFVLPLGAATASLPSMLTSMSGASIVAALREQFRYVIVDGGLVRRDPGGMLLASLADGVVMALAIAARRRDEVVNFHEELQRLNIPLLGVVLTRMAR
jgi:Mrp family chromosome partitioning ATPase